MIKFLKLNLGLIKFLNVELRKEKTSQEYIKFFKNIIIPYYKVNLQNYKDLFKIFDPEYRKQKGNFKKYQQYRKDVTNAFKIIQYMVKQGETRDARKYIKRDFEKHGIISKEFEKELLRVIYGVK